jgi:SAM-dependent methyltransferase
MSQIYDQPKYYEIAFDFRDLNAEVDLMEECMSRYSEPPSESVLELACGNCPHAIELVKRGYGYTGIDNNEQMLNFSRSKARSAGVELSLVNADLVDFSLVGKFDFVYILVGSLFVRDDRELVSHFDSVARCLRRGGLYLLDWCIEFEPPGQGSEVTSWEMKRGDIAVTTAVRWKAVNLAAQTFEERISFDICDNGRKLYFEDSSTRRALYPQEFLMFIKARPDFEFIGWWNLWDLTQPLEKASKVDRPVVLIRRI